MIPPRTDRGSSRLATLLEEGRARARAAGKPVLVSLAEPARDLDPLAVIAAAQGAPDGDPMASLAATGAMYWERPDDQFALAGLGAVLSIEATGTGRFAEVDDRWSAALEGAVVDDPSEGGAVVGPVLMGGFAFSPDGPTDPAWTGFPSAALVLPRVLVARSGTSSWVTTTLCVSPDGRADADLDAVVELRARLLRTADDAGSEATGANPGALAFSDLRDAGDWRDLVESATATIRDGAFEKVVLARAVQAEAPGPLDALAAVRQLREAFPSTYVFAFWRGDRAFAGATPERLVRLDGDRVLSSSLAGSIGRGSDAADDARRAAMLLDSAKDRAEHEMVRRVLCAGLAEVCDDVDAAAVPSILTLPQVHHLHTPVRARLRDGHSLLELVGRLHPTPAVGGTPNEAALRFISAYEGLDRGWYAAPVGWLGTGHGEFAVALRSALIAGHTALLYAGCGIMADSRPESEYEESLLKLRPMQLALAAAVSSPETPADPAPRRAAAGGHVTR